jgi:hypothetical protein
MTQLIVMVDEQSHHIPVQLWHTALFPSRKRSSDPSDGHSVADPLGVLSTQQAVQQTAVPGVRSDEEPGTRISMPRETKHGPRTDEAMARETGNLSTNAVSRAEGRLQEPAVEGEPAPESGARPGPALSGVSEDEAEIRRQLLHELAGASFPATRNDLLRFIGPDERGPTEARLRMLPPDLKFDSAEHLLTALGGMSTGR